MLDWVGKVGHASWFERHVILFFELLLVVLLTELFLYPVYRLHKVRRLHISVGATFIRFRAGLVPLLLRCSHAGQVQVIQVVGVGVIYGIKLILHVRWPIHSYVQGKLICRCVFAMAEWNSSRILSGRWQQVWLGIAFRGFLVPKVRVVHVPVPILFIVRYMIYLVDESVHPWEPRHVSVENIRAMSLHHVCWCVGTVFGL